MRDPKLWLDLITAVWLVWVGAIMRTENVRSGFLFKVVPICLAFVLAMAHAKTLF